MTVEQFESLAIDFCIPALILYMLFILYRLGKDSGAGGYGSAVIFFSLGLGIVGFAAKTVIQLFMTA